MRRSLISVLSVIMLAGCSLTDTPCEQEYEDFEGTFTGAAIALQNGDLYLNLTPDCSLAVGGGFRFHQHVAEVWKDADYGHDYWRALKVHLVGKIELYKREHDYHVLVLREPWELSSDVSKEDAERAFNDGMRRTIDGAVLN